MVLNSKFQNLNINSTRYYVSNSDTKPSQSFKYNSLDSKSEFNPRSRNFPRKLPDFKRKREAVDRLASNEEDFSDAEPIEASGKQADYSNKDHHSFRDYDIPERLLNRLDELGYKVPFEIQEKTLKHTLAGKDLVGKAFTGSGKTLAFAIPIISRIMKSENKTSRYPKCLVLSPTRELCLQLTKTIQDLAPEMKCISIVGGTGYESQISALNRKVDIVCATPGRLRDLMNRKNFIPDDIEIVCLDEADELLNPNFLEQIQDVIELTNKKQMLMFSATINKSVYGVISKYMKDPVAIDLTEGQKHKLPSNIEHYVIEAPGDDNVVSYCLEEFKSEKCIIFTNMKREAISLNYALNRKGIKSSDLHSDLSQTKRELILKQFRSGRLDVIVATDVAARGIDIPEVDLVIQVGAPASGIDFYIHRSGRTGRAGRIGKSILIDDGSKNNFMRMISRLVKFKYLDLPESIAETIESTPRPNKFEDEFRGSFKKFDRFTERSYGQDRDYRSIKKFNKPYNRNFRSDGEYKPYRESFNRENFNKQFDRDYFDRE